MKRQNIRVLKNLVKTIDCVKILNYTMQQERRATEYNRKFSVKKLINLGHLEFGRLLVKTFEKNQNDLNSIEAYKANKTC